VIEDAAHALPAAYRGRKVGTLSELTAFSFYATKTLTTGEGGMLTTDDDEFAQRISVMRLHGIGGDAWKRYAHEGSWYYEVHYAGYKMNLCDILSALGRTQLQKCDQMWQKRSTIQARYHDAFSQISALELPPEAADGGQHAWHLYIIRIRPDCLNINRNQFIEALKKLGIGTSVHFIPLHLHPYYARAYGYAPDQFPNANDAYSRCISLPLYPDMSEAEVTTVIRGVTAVVQENLKRKAVLVNC
jgi:perosamine synthetase